MPVQIQPQPNDIYVIRINGVLKQFEFSAQQSAVGRNIDTGSKPRLLIILETLRARNAALIGII
jgi:hypothetical protein